MKKTRKSILASLMAVMMLFSLMPATVFATGADSAPAGCITAFAEVKGITATVGTARETLALPKSLAATAGGPGVVTEEPVAVPVESWVCEGYDAAAAGSYIFIPALGELPFPLGEGVQPPTITVTLTEASEGAPDIITSEQQAGEARVITGFTARNGAREKQPVTATVDLTGYNSFKAAVEAQLTSLPYDEITTLTITMKTTGSVWTSDDGVYFGETFPNVTELDLGNFTGRFGEYAFLSSDVEKVRLPESVQVSYEMFSGCSSLKTLVCGPANTNPFKEEGVIDLSGAASFRDSAFSYSGVEKVRLPADVAISIGMFSHCENLATLSVAGNTGEPNVIDLTGFIKTYGNRSFSYCTSITKVKLPSAVAISDNMFFNCENLATLSVGDNPLKTDVIELTGFTQNYGRGEFRCCTSIKKVKLPADVAISEDMFSYCKNLAALSVGDNPLKTDVIDLTGFTKTYHSSAFQGCTSIKKVKLPADVAISNNMFYGCKNLATLSVGNNPAETNVIDLTGFTQIYGSGVFQGCTSIKKVKLPADVAIYDKMFFGCDSLTTLSVGDDPGGQGVIDLSAFSATCGNSAFQSCTSIKVVKLSATITISNNIFDGCKSLTTLSVGDNPAETDVIDLSHYAKNTCGSEAFSGCTSIKKVKLPADVAISGFMFFGCDSLTTMSVGDNPAETGVIDLSDYANNTYGRSAFQNCTSIKAVKLPSAAGISDLMFYGCGSLDMLLFYGTVAPDVGINAFTGVTEGGTLYYPRGGMRYTPGTFGESDFATWRFAEAFGPKIAAQPSEQSGRVGETVTFAFGVNGAPLAFQWQWSADGINWADLADGGGYAGTATDMLVIDNLQQEQNRLRFRCVVSNTGGYGPDITSEAAALTVNAATTLQPPSTPYDKAAAGNPQTGDLFDPRPYLLLMLSALAGCASLLRYRRRSA